MIHFRSRGTPTALARILIASLLLTGCGSGYPIPPELENTTLVEGTTVEEAPQSEEMPDLDAMGMDVSSMVDQNLPEGFPDAFPIPPGAEVFSNIHMPNEGEYWVYFSITDHQHIRNFQILGIPNFCIHTLSASIYFHPQPFFAQEFCNFVSIFKMPVCDWDQDGLCTPSFST